MDSYVCCCRKALHINLACGMWTLEFSDAGPLMLPVMVSVITIVERRWHAYLSLYSCEYCLLQVLQTKLSGYSRGTIVLWRKRDRKISVRSLLFDGCWVCRGWRADHTWGRRIHKQFSVWKESPVRITRGQIIGFCFKIARSLFFSWIPNRFLVGVGIVERFLEILWVIGW